ncbi:MAG: DNA translocase FtsK 4TM domain-containing protein, partial [Rickettsiales bacterium]|nr:DNA translocase FtsK 4TM domain-containing protein [Rickettsiales bacterium]
MAVHKQNIVPDGIRHYIGSLARKALGAALITAAAYMLASLVSYSPSDSSLFTVGTFPTRNWGGASGANAAAFMLQFFGLFPLLFVYDVYLLGRSFIQPAHLKHGARAIFLALVFSAPFACLSLSYASGVFLETFPTETGLGGLLGHIIKSDIASVLDNAGISGAMAAILFVLSTVVWLATMYFTLNLDQDSIIRFESRIARAYHGIANFMRLKIFGKKARQPDARTESKILSMLKIRSPKKRAEARPPAPVQRTPSKSKYRLPPLSLLNAARADNSSGANEELNEKKARMLEATLAEFGVVGRIASIKTGPVITLFEMEPGKGVKTSRITALAEDIARDMSALSARVAVIPGTNKIGIELPNMHRKTVYIREQLESSAFRNSEYSLPISLGKDTGGRPVFVDLAKMPHLLIA